MCLTWLTTQGACTRSWELSSASGGAAGGPADAGTGSGGSTGSGSGGGGGGGTSGGEGGRTAGAGAGGWFVWPGSGGRGHGGEGGLAGLNGQAGGVGFPNGSGGRSGWTCPTPPSGSINVADVLFLVARNQSMGSAFGGDSSRIAAVTKAIQFLVESAFPYAVRYAYADYPSRLGCNTGGNSCCVSSDYWFNIGNLTFKSDGMLSCDASPQNNSCVVTTDGRPVAEALMRVSQWLSSSTSATNNRYAILIADGAPGCPGEADACNDAIAAITNIAQPPTRLNQLAVVALGEEASKSMCLRSMAQEGGYFDLPLPATPTDASSLRAILTQIVTKAASDYCIIKLNDPADPTSVKISAWGGDIKRDPSRKNGWEFTPGDQFQRIQVYGDFCGKLQAAPRSEITISYSCSSPGSP
jgi:hypothetical protein